MVNVYTRHRAECEHAEDMRWRRCRCPKWIRGVLINGKVVRESAKTRSWEQAERVARKMEEDADPTTADQAKPCRVTVAEAVQMFLKDEEARGLEAVSRKSRKPSSSASSNPGAKNANCFILTSSSPST
jgi:hypothetical protein